ncbi:hypothetical protein M0R45_037502 [Rubus argutus]|uniref:S-protein homolog n=1 Tax=Rubus argutus TaxID=59490 RepID=A0AAW1W2M6_RUBAR
MTSHFQRNVVPLALVLLVVLSATSTVSAGWGWPRHTVVKIRNLLKDDAVSLKLHCQSKDDDLGEHSLASRESYSFEFRTNIMKTTLFFCRFEFENRVQYFDIFRNSRDDCKSCFWDIVEEGPCLWGIDGVCYQWNKD